MRRKQTANKLLSLLLSLCMIVGLLPVSVIAAETTEEKPIVLIGGGDYQEAGDHTASSENVTNILNV